MASFTIRCLLAAVALLAVGLAALLNANSLWRSGMMNLVVLLFALALVGMRYAAPANRAFCGGFLILGLTYFLLATQWWKFDTTWELLPQTALRQLHGRMFRPQDRIVHVDAYLPDADVNYHGRPLPDGTVQASVVRPSRENFVGVGAALYCVLFGLLGGFVATRMHRKTDGFPK